MISEHREGSLAKFSIPLLFRHLLVWKFLKCLECIKFLYFCQNIWRHLCNISPQRYFLEFWSIFSHLVTYITVVWQRCHILFPRPLYIMRIMFPPHRRHDNFGRPSPETQGPWAQSSRWEKHDDHDVVAIEEMVLVLLDREINSIKNQCHEKRWNISKELK